MQKFEVPRKTRIAVSLTLIGATCIVLLSVSGAWNFGAGQKTGLPETIQSITNQFQPKPKPVTIFDPPKYSIDEADSIWVVANKRRQISPLRYQPASLAFPAFERPKVQNPFGLQLREEAAVAAADLASAMAADDKGTLILNSGFRTYKNQQGLYNRTRDTRGLAVAEKLSARPGHSEHQLGLAADFSVKGQGCVIMVCFGKTEAGIWLAENAHEFGFVLRYPKGYRPITGFQYEPWHFRYVGFELATEMKTKGIKTLEEFWGLGSAPDYTDPAG
jgi:D-alanyl-D-alanine carboxypeptidase